MAASKRYLYHRLIASALRQWLRRLEMQQGLERGPRASEARSAPGAAAT